VERDLVDLLPSAARAYAYSLLALPGAFDDRLMARKIVTGICTTTTRNSNGRVFDPAGAVAELPLPLLFAHRWDTPIGRVLELNATPEGLLFRARIIDGRFAWATEIWALLKSGGIGAAS